MKLDRRRRRPAERLPATKEVTNPAADSAAPEVDQVREVARQAFERIKAGRERAAKLIDR